jgi:hypothetical protein
MATSKKKNIIIKMDSPKKRGPGRPRKDVVITEDDLSGFCDIPGFFQPTEHDLHDELIRMDAFTGGRY